MDTVDSSTESDCVLDVQGLECPLPVLRARVELRRMTPGQVLHVIATDPLAPLDFRAFCVRTGHALLRLDEKGGDDGNRVDVYIRRAADPS